MQPGVDMMELTYLKLTLFNQAILEVEIMLLQSKGKFWGSGWTCDYGSTENQF